MVIPACAVESALKRSAKRREILDKEEFQEIDDHSKKGFRGFRLVQLIFSFLIFVVRDRSEKRYFESISTKNYPTEILQHLVGMFNSP